jgi:hypothetical protein
VLSANHKHLGCFFFIKTFVDFAQASDEVLVYQGPLFVPLKKLHLRCNVFEGNQLAGESADRDA